MNKKHLTLIITLLMCLAGNVCVSLASSKTADTSLEKKFETVKDLPIKFYEYNVDIANNLTVVLNQDEIFTLLLKNNQSRRWGIKETEKSITETEKVYKNIYLSYYVRHMKDFKVNYIEGGFVAKASLSILQKKMENHKVRKHLHVIEKKMVLEQINGLCEPDFAEYCPDQSVGCLYMRGKLKKFVEKFSEKDVANTNRTIIDKYKKKIVVLQKQYLSKSHKKNILPVVYKDSDVMAKLKKCSW